MQKYDDWDNNIGNYHELINEINKLNQSFYDNNYIQSLADYGSYCIKNGINFVFDIDYVY